MKKVCALILLSIFCIPLAASAAELSHKTIKKKKPILQSIDNITVGPAVTKDNELLKLYGEGYFVRDEGHGGGRYFANKDYSLTLHVVIGVDGIIEEVSVREGFHVPGLTKDSAPAVIIANKLGGNVKLGLGIKLGMTVNALIAILGQPDSKEFDKAGVQLLKYETSEDIDSRVSLDYEATYEFNNGQLTGIILYDGE